MIALIEYFDAYFRFEGDPDRYKYLWCDDGSFTEYSSGWEYAFYWIFSSSNVKMCAFLFSGVAASIITIIWFDYAIKHSYHLDITSKHLSGRMLFGRKVEIPLEQISFVIVRYKTQLTVVTDSHRFTFRYLKNTEELYTCINKLIAEPQEEKIDK